MTEPTPFFEMGSPHPRVPLLLTVPHSGEWVPPEADWLRGCSESLLMTDVDRFVDQLYRPVAEAVPVPAMVTRVHRYAVDLNRYADDVDRDSVEGAEAKSGAFTKGLHWVTTTRGEPLIRKPISRELHERLVAKYHRPFFEKVRERGEVIRQGGLLFHLDCHSMPSQGTALHADGGQARPEVVISDFNGRSSTPAFKDLLIEAFRAQGFEVSYNWPYQGGRITQRFGRPSEGWNTLQIELNRKLYMDETTRTPLPEMAALQTRLQSVMTRLVEGLFQGVGASAEGQE